MVSLQSIIWVFLLNNFSRIINLLLTKLAWDCPGRILALGLFCTDLATLGPYCQDLGPIFSQYGPRAWLIRYMYHAIYESTVQVFMGWNMWQNQCTGVAEHEISYHVSEPSKSRAFLIPKKDNRKISNQCELHQPSENCTFSFSSFLGGLSGSG